MASGIGSVQAADAPTTGSIALFSSLGGERTKLFYRWYPGSAFHPGTRILVEVLGQDGWTWLKTLTLALHHPRCPDHGCSGHVVVDTRNLSEGWHQFRLISRLDHASPTSESWIDRTPPRVTIDIYGGGRTTDSVLEDDPYIVRGQATLWGSAFDEDHDRSRLIASGRCPRMWTVRHEVTGETWTYPTRGPTFDFGAIPGPYVVTFSARDFAGNLGTTSARVLGLPPQTQ